MPIFSECPVSPLVDSLGLVMPTFNLFPALSKRNSDPKASLAVANASFEWPNFPPQCRNATTSAYRQSIDMEHTENTMLDDFG